MRLAKSHALSLVAALASGSSVWAQEQANLASSKAITAPNYALARIPKGGKSRFYGSAVFGAPLNQEVRVHFYQWPQLNPPQVDPSGQREDSDQNYRIDFFVRGLKHSRPFHLAQSVEIPSITFDSQRYSFNSVEIHAEWLKPKQHKFPTVRLTCTNTGGFYGPFGTDLYLVFDRGWFMRPDVETFEFHGDHNDSTETFFGIDKEGTPVIARESRLTDAAQFVTTDVYVWDGRKFVLSRREVSGLNVHQ